MPPTRPAPRHALLTPSQYAALSSLGTYGSWSVKLACGDDDIEGLRRNLQTQRVLGPQWRDNNADNFMKLGSTKPHVKDLIEIMEDDDKREWMEGVCNTAVFPFTYDGIADANPNPGFDLEEFRKGRHVAVEFTTHAINFRTKKNLRVTFRYFYRLQSIYLVDGGKRQVSTPSRRKRGPDEWLVSPQRTRKTNVHDNPLDWTVSKLGKEKRGEDH